MQHNFIIIFLMICLPLAVASQDLILDNNPASMKWRQINTPGFRIIYPVGFDQESQRVANTLEHLRSEEAETMGDKTPKKVSIILQNQNAVSNGFVALGPRRLELYTMPPQDYNFLGTNKWLDMLAVHEYRHLVQFEHSKTGWNKLFYYLFGENTQAGLAFAAAPPWFWEGDATATETIFTQSGRGRMPSFNRVFRANLLEGKRYNYHKQHLRSYKDFIPNHYVLGYHFVTHLRRRTHDPDILEKVSRSAFSWPFIPFTFSNALKKHTGKYLVKNYELMMDELDSVWTDQLKGLNVTSFSRINQRRTEDFTDYSYPQALENGKVIALKSGIGDVAQFIQFDENGKARQVFIPGFMNNTGMLSAAQNKVVWNEYHYDPRWRIKTYSVIKAYDFETGKSHTITNKSRYAGAAISPDGDKIVTVLTTTDQQHYLLVLDYDTGTEINRFENQENAFYAMPRWSEDGRQIVALKLTGEGKAVIALDATSGTVHNLIGATDENIGHPVLLKNFLFYNSPVSGIDNIYALDRSSGQRYQVTSSKYGAYNPAISPDGTSIYYNDYTVDGLDVVKIPFNPDSWQPIETVEDRSVQYYEPLVEQEGHEAILDDIPMVKYPVKKYSKLGHIINIHSWGPYASTDLNSAQFGIFSRDVLSTTDISLGYTYDINEETGFASAKISYQGFYPIIDFEVQRGNRTSDALYRDENNDIQRIDFAWNETSYSIGLRLPLVLTRSKFIRSFTLGNSVDITKASSFENSLDNSGRVVESADFIFRDELDNGILINNVATVSFANLMKRSTRDLSSRWGQSATAEWWTSPYGGDFQSGLFAFRSNFYFPSPFHLLTNASFLKHHAVTFRYSFQWLMLGTESDSYHLRNRIAKPRGFSYPFDEGFTYLSTNYSFPIFYPDVALGPFLNIKRLRANLFYDYGLGQTTLPELDIERKRVYESIGGELFVDFNVMRFSPEVSLGARYSYLLSTGETNIEFLVANIAF
ncbi:MAG: hypothetical protein WD555_01290 [Fulvivirga sp.]